MDLTGLGSVFDVLGKVVDRVFPDPSIKADLIKTLNEGQTAIAQGQLEVNKVEAASSSLFVAGWRPFCGWACGIGFVYGAMLQPVLSWVAPSVGLSAPPPADLNAIIGILGGLLGLGGLRTFEKVKGVA